MDINAQSTLKFRPVNELLQDIKFKIYDYIPGERIGLIAQRELGSIKYMWHILYLSEILDPYDISNDVVLRIPTDSNEADKMQL